ncbi:MAG: ABC transporter permease [Firmicutes bacterium]|nr:ABC transporter permease [Bacillota bacterium]
MRVKTVGYFFQQAAASIKRNGWMSIASIITMTFCLMVLGTALLLLMNTSNMVASIESNVEILAYVKAEVRPQSYPELENRLRSQPQVSQVEFISKDDALKGMQQRYGSQSDLVSALGGKNPLPDTYKIQVSKPSDVIQVATDLTAWPEFEKVRYGQGVVERLFALTRWIKIVSFSVMGFLALAAIFFISTTIRLTMSSRQVEIGIMKLVGATNWFIRWPLFLEGIFFGLTGAILAVGTLSGLYLLLLKNVQANLSFLSLVSDPSLLFGIFGGLLVTGVVLGAVGTIVSIYRFTDV